MQGMVAGSSTNNNKLELRDAPVHVIHIEDAQNDRSATDAVRIVRSPSQRGVGEFEMEAGERREIPVLLRHKNRMARRGAERH